MLRCLLGKPPQPVVRSPFFGAMPLFALPSTSSRSGQVLHRAGQLHPPVQLCAEGRGNTRGAGVSLAAWRGWGGGVCVCGGVGGDGLGVGVCVGGKGRTRCLPMPCHLNCPHDPPTLPPFCHACLTSGGSKRDEQVGMRVGAVLPRAGAVQGSCPEVHRGDLGPLPYLDSIVSLQGTTAVCIAAAHAVPR